MTAAAVPPDKHAVAVPGAEHATATGAGAARFPWLVVGTFSLLLAYPHIVSFAAAGIGIQAAQFTIVAASLVVLVGWVGQISLGHAALVGIGGYATGWATQGWGITFPFNLLIAGAFAAAAAAVLGSVALRVRGLYLAVATLIFSWMADEWLFRIPTVVEHSILDSLPMIGDPDGLPRFDFGHRPTSFYIAWGIALVVLLTASTLRRTGTGRAWFAVSGSEVGAASLGIDVTRTKLQAFIVSGFLAGLAGSLIMLDAGSLSPEDFNFTRSLFFLAIAVVGGLSSLGGAVASAVFFAFLNWLFFEVSALGEALDLVSALLLAVMLLAYRGGLAAVPGSIGRAGHRVERLVEERGGDTLRWLVRWYPERLREEWAIVRGWVGDRTSSVPRLRWVRPADADADADTASDADAAATGTDAGPVGETGGTSAARPAVTGAPAELPTDRADRELVLEARAITVKFGGLVAVSDASLEVRRHEIVGLIGPNGAGKTTFFNAIAGLNSPAEGRVSIFGEDVTALAVHERARRGVARTFQAIQLFPELDVFENLLVATHVHNPTGFFRQAFGTDHAVTGEVEMRRRVDDVIDRLELGDVADRKAGDLPFGVLRVVELGRALVTGFPLLMLDEPASGLDNTETERFSEILRKVRAEGTSLLLIEHDVNMVVSLCDYIYVINRGAIIAEGTAAQIQSDPAVRAAYLGTDAGDGAAA